MYPGVDRLVLRQPAQSASVMPSFKHLEVAFVNDSETVCALMVLHDASSKFNMLHS